MSKQLRQVLATIERPGAFAVRRDVSASDLRLEVSGVGPIALPISRTQARQLWGVARPARHGFKDQTRLDRRVRGTWEIVKSRIKINQRLWKKTLIAELELMRHALGLASGSELRAELHNLLVYAPGQFFVPHQDSEKSDDMIGTLVVTLPSQVKGGAMIVQHHDERITFRGSRTKLTLIGFYADCHHEVRRVTEGHRVVLTYNLLVSDGGAAMLPPAAASQLETLEHQVRDFFRTVPEPRWSGEVRHGPPDRLVYLLDHEYTRRGLGWSRLKNCDAARAAALREVARRLDCEIFLAQADVHETWSCEEEEDTYDFRYGRYGRFGGHPRRRYEPWDDEEDDDDLDEDVDDEASRIEGIDEAPDLIDLQDWSVELRHFVGERGKTEPVSSFVDDKEICYTKPSVEMHPFKSEHEGYMGNWGNTVDRWYHRAAIVLWPRERTFILRAKTSARWAIDQVARTLGRKQIEQARSMVERLAPFWLQIARRDVDATLITKSLRVALALEEPELAAALVRPFRLEQLSPKLAPLLGALVERYGLGWYRAACGSEPSHGDDQRRIAWLSTLPAFVRALCESGAPAARALACAVVSGQWAWLMERYRIAAKAPPSRRLDQLSRYDKPMLGLIESSRVCDGTGMHADMLRMLTSDTCPALALVRLLERAHSAHAATELGRLGLDVVHAHCVTELTARMGRQVRAQDDWSIAPPQDCSCALCHALAQFLADPKHVRLEWPLAKDKRRHVHGMLDLHELPVSHTTRRSGSPHTLVLVKTRALFEGEEKERAACRRALAWLKKRERAFRPAMPRPPRASRRVQHAG